ncbi:MAG: hypothetical protein GXY54_11770 [Deltaproteobacteria bacterium]|nr:hypothetical protein [Deltaproteobacteria bacterium]
MLISAALQRLQTGIVYRTRLDGDEVKVVLKDGKVTRVLINNVTVDRGEGVERELSLTLEDLLLDDWEVAQGF